MDEDGYVWYAGRADDVIISAGYRIGPFEVESACVEHPAVKEAAAVASPDAKRGDIVKAFIVLAAGHEGSDETADEIKQFVRGHLSAYAYPREIEFVDDLPKTLTGKIRRIELREAERAKQGARAPAPAGCRRAAPRPRTRPNTSTPITPVIAFWRGVAFSARWAALSAHTIAFSRMRSARSNSSARKLSPIRITRMPGPGTPGPDITIPASTSSTPMITTPIRRTMPAFSWRFLRSWSLRSRSGTSSGSGPRWAPRWWCSSSVARSVIRRAL